jgi:hypothetical protein
MLRSHIHCLMIVASKPISCAPIAKKSKKHNHNSSFPSPLPFLPLNPNIFMIIPPSEPSTRVQRQPSLHIDRTNTPRERVLPPGGYILPLLSICGPQPQRWFSETESRTDGIWEPHPNHVAPPGTFVRLGSREESFLGYWRWFR